MLSLHYASGLLGKRRNKTAWEGWDALVEDEEILLWSNGLIQGIRSSLGTLHGGQDVE
jgi:hypothetical protein